MDIIDVILARAMTPEQSIITYESAAARAANSATTAASQAETAVAGAAQALEDAQTALSSLTGAADTEIDKIVLSASQDSTAEAVTTDLTANYPSENSSTVEDLIKFYKTTGQNEDGGMTQKAITDELNYIKQHGGGGGGTGNFGSENEGKIVVVDEHGGGTAGTITEGEIIEALVDGGSYILTGAVGLEIDYPNKITTRSQEAKSLSMGAAFNKYKMFGGRMRCNVADDGTINAFYGDDNYREDGSNGQVMVYQPKFYYRRIVTNTKNATVGKAIQNEQIIVSSAKQPGFKLHPLFKKDGVELEYVLLSAYESCAYDVSLNSYDLASSASVDFTEDKLSSIAGAKPLSGLHGAFTVAAAEQMAQNRGSNWHISNLQAESANQMLEFIEFGTLNGQAALGQGVVNVSSQNGVSSAAITGSTASLGNSSGEASSTINDIGGVQTEQTASGKVAISYRGYENPWGNIWRMIGGCNVYGNSYMGGGVPYVCMNYNYTPNYNGENYQNVGFCAPSTYDWISALGYSSEEYDWVIFPASCGNGANSAGPVGDNMWTIGNLNGYVTPSIGGTWSMNNVAGPCCYALDRRANEYSRSYGARLMFVPTVNSIYNNNIAKWLAKWEA